MGKSMKIESRLVIASIGEEWGWEDQYKNLIEHYLKVSFWGDENILELVVTAKHNSVIILKPMGCIL